MIRIVVLSILLAVSAVSAAEKPNLVVLLADDMCYNALSYTGNAEVQTPNIDSICEQGIFCTQAYVTHGVCAPSRAGLMTGRYQARFGYETLSGPTEHAMSIRHGVDVNEVTLAQMLKEQGYTSAAYGKWHLGVNHEFQPLQRGFDHQYGFAGGGGPYWERDNHGLVRDGKPVEWPKGGYQTDFLTDDAIAWMRQVAPEKPFFLYFSPYAVHAPFHAPKELIPKGKHPMVGMMKSLDNNIGRILKALDELGERDNTVVVFLSDNGGVPKVFKHGFTNAPYRGGKATVLEGGIHVPFALHWPGRIEGNRYEGIVSSLDLMPTFAAAAGAALPTDREYDGINLLPHLTGKAAPKGDRTLCWRWRNGHAVRRGKWKLVWEINWGAFHTLRKKQGMTEPAPTMRPNPDDRFTALYFDPKLYDLSNDPGEETDLSAQYPEVLDRLKAELVKFDALAKPLSEAEKEAWPRPQDSSRRKTR